MIAVRARVRGAGEKCVTGHSRVLRGAPRAEKIASDMTRVHIHKPPSQAIVAELVRAGVSHETAMAMERWKAEEVLDLLRFGPERATPVMSAAKLR